METQQILSSARKILTPLETENIIHFARTLSVKTALENPILIGIFLILFFFGVVKRSKPVLLTIFATVALLFLIQYTLPTDPGGDLTLKSTIPFAFGGLGIGAAVIYFIFIKGE